MKNVQKLTDNELREIAAGAGVMDLIKKYGPEVLDQIMKLLNKDGSSSSSSGGTTATPSTVTNGPTFTNNTNNGGFNTSGNTQSQMGNNNGNIAGSQTINIGGAKN